MIRFSLLVFSILTLSAGAQKKFGCLNEKGERLIFPEEWHGCKC